MARRKEASASSIPMVKPNYDSRPTGPTLLDVAAVRNAAQSAIDELPPSPWELDIVTFSLGLTMLHLTLNVLVHNQYGAAPPTLWPLVWQSARVMPFIFLAVWVPRTDVFMRHDWIKQTLHFALGTGAGCFAIAIANQGGYLDVMAQAPGLGVAWVWSVIEMQLIPAVASVAICAASTWWNGFSLM